MKSMKKMCVLIMASLTLCGGALLATNFVKNVSFTLAAETKVVWMHYSEVAPTATEPGIKEYWVSCSDSTHTFTAPTGNVDIQEGSWTQSKINSVIELNDDRLIPADPAYVSSKMSTSNGIYLLFNETQYAWLKENVRDISFDIDFNDSALTNYANGDTMTLANVGSVSFRSNGDGVFMNFSLTNGVAHVVIDSNFFDSDLTQVRFRLKGTGNENINFTNAVVTNVKRSAKPASPAFDIPEVISSTNGLYTLYNETNYAWLKENVKSVSMDIDFNDSTLTNVSGGAAMTLANVGSLSIRATASDSAFKSFTLTNGVAHVVIDSSFFDSAITYVRFRLKGTGNENINFTNAVVSNIKTEDKPASPAFDIPEVIGSTNGLYTLYNETNYAWLKENVKSVSMDIDFNDSTLTNVSGGAAMTLADVENVSIRATASDSAFKNFTLTNGVAHVVIDSSFFDSAITYVRFRLKGTGNENINFTNAAVSNITVTEKPLNPAYNLPSTFNGGPLVDLYDTTAYAWMKENVASVSFDVDFNVANLISADNGTAILEDLTNFTLRTGASGSAGSLAKNFAITNGVAHVVFDSTVFSNDNVVLGKFLLKNAANGNVKFENAAISNLVVTLLDA